MGNGRQLLSPNSLQDNIFQATLQNNILQTCESGQYFMKRMYKSENNCLKEQLPFYGD